MTDHEITASWDQLLEDAREHAGNHMRKAVREIDGEFGEGYAKGNPALVAAFMQTAARDLHMSGMNVAAQGIADTLRSIGDAISNVADAIREAEERRR